MIGMTSAMFAVAALAWLVLDWAAYRSASQRQPMSMRIKMALAWVIVIGGLAFVIDRFSA